MPYRLPKTRVVGVEISLGSFPEHLSRIAEYAKQSLSSYVCCVNSHMAVEASNDPDFAKVVNGAEIATADGMPITRAVQWLSKHSQVRVAGNDLLPALLQRAEEEGINVYFYGGKQSTIDKICKRAVTEFPKLKIAGAESPPFKQLTDEEMNDTAARINAVSSQMVFVSLGCPKQERWMAAMHGKINAVMIGIGGAFLLYAGEDSRAPKWMRDLCLEWTYRLALEPRRLWKRYLITNSIFVWILAKDSLSRFRPKREIDG